MRAQLKIYKQLCLLCIGCFVIVSIFFLLEQQKNSTLEKRLSALDNTIAPYYDKDVFKLPQNVVKNQKSKTVKIPIIMYHYVEDIEDKGDIVRKRLNIAPALFEQHLQTLKDAHYEMYFVKDIPDILNGSTHYSSSSAILTFDDGYVDFYTVVFPLLKKYHMRATVYVIYDYIGRKGFLSESQIAELIQSGLVEIGSHTLDHVYLKQAPDIYAQKQIAESKINLETRFKIPIMTLAYPYGAFNNKNIEFAKEAGYTAAVSVIPGVLQNNENLFFLSRIRPEQFTPQTLIQTLERMNK